MEVDTKNKIMFNILEYTYYSITKFYIKNESKNGIEDNKRTGAYAVGILIAFNIMSLIGIFLSVFTEKSDVLSDLLFPVSATILLICVFSSIYYFVTKKHNFIFKKYDKKSKKTKNTLNFLVMVYILITVLFMFFAVYMGRNNWI